MKSKLLLLGAVSLSMLLLAVEAKAEIIIVDTSNQQELNQQELLQAYKEAKQHGANSAEALKAKLQLQKALNAITLKKGKGCSQVTNLTDLTAPKPCER